MKKILIAYVGFFFAIIMIVVMMSGGIDSGEKNTPIANKVNKVLKVDFTADLTIPSLTIKFKGEEMTIKGVYEDGGYVFKTKAEEEKDKEKKVWRWFRQSGFSEEATALLTAYLDAKSGIDEGADGEKIGICRWEGERAEELKKEEGWQDLTEQLNYMYSELSNDYYFTDLETFKKETDFAKLKELFRKYDDLEINPEETFTRNKGSAVLHSADIHGKEEDGKFTFEGTLNGELVMGEGKIEESKVEGTAYWGNGAKAYLGEFMSPYGETPFTVTSPFGYRVHPIEGVESYHSGWDIASAGTDTPVVATKDGTITLAEPLESYGNLVILEVEGGLAIYHGHLKQISVTKGQEVKKGDVLGIEGTTGMSTGVHLHWEFRLNGNRVDPDDFANNVLSMGTDYESIKAQQVKKTDDRTDIGGKK